MIKKQAIRLNESQLRRIVREAVSEYGNSFHKTYWEDEGQTAKEAIKQLVKKMKNDDNFKTMNAQSNNWYLNRLIEDYFKICKSIDTLISGFIRISGNDFENKTDEFGDNLNY